jgi:MoaA/NifB/PqqE/SkfB family radical SAM enzyme
MRLVQYIKTKFKRTPARPDQPHKNFCVLPFIHLATTTEGTCRLCCKVSRFDTINKPDGTPYNVNVDSIDEIWNSAHYNKIRDKMLADEQLPECATCWREEEIFRSDWSKYRKDELPSKRRIENQKWLHREKTRLTDDWTTVVDEPEIRYFDVRLSNLCNLKCRMCWPHFSSQIVKEQKQFAAAGLPTHYKEYDLPDWDDTLLWEGIENNLVKLEEITFVGGEPTLHEGIDHLLDRLVSSGQSKTIRLKFTTNLTNIQPKTLEYMRHFKSTIINGSIDGVGATNDYIRYPSDWKTIEKNIFKLLTRRRINYEERSGYSLTLTPVIQIYNVFNIHDLVKWYVTNWLDIDHMSKKYFILNLDLLYDPSHLSVKRLNATGRQHWHQHTFLPTLEYLDDIIDNIDDFDRDSRDYWSILIELRKKVVNIAIYMEVLTYRDDGKLTPTHDAPDIEHNPKLAKKLADYTRQLDKHRGQDVNDIIPGFYEYIK